VLRDICFSVGGHAVNNSEVYEYAVHSVSDACHLSNWINLLQEGSPDEDLRRSAGNTSTIAIEPQTRTRATNSFHNNGSPSKRVEVNKPTIGTASKPTLATCAGDNVRTLNQAHMPKREEQNTANKSARPTSRLMDNGEING